MADTVTVHVAGVNVNKTVTIADGSPAADALAEAQVAAVEGGLQVRVNGAPVDPAQYTPSHGDTIYVVPPAVKLGA